MRLRRTDVLPAPAPATKSIGPCTSSMAWRWRSSGINEAEREVDFTGIGARISSAAMWRRGEPDTLVLLAVQIEKGWEVAIGGLCYRLEKCRTYFLQDRQNILASTYREPHIWVAQRSRQASGSRSRSHQGSRLRKNRRTHSSRTEGEVSSPA